MLNAINTKILMAILGVLTVMASAAVYQRLETAKAAAAAAKAAAILEQQEKRTEKQKEQDDVFRKRVEQDRARHNSAAAHEGKTWTTYLP